MAQGELVLLTGLTGFIAKHTALALLRAGYRVRATVRDEARAKPVIDMLAKHDVDVSRLTLARADLKADAGWAEACAGCTYVVHMASPFPLQQPDDRMALVPEARDGALRVLRAAHGAGVKRMVLTSSVVAVGGGHPLRPGHVWTEEDWADVESKTINAYRLSKALAERAAWDEAKKLGLDMVALNPTFVLGPALDDAPGASVDSIKLMLSGKYPAVPDLAFPVVDVRDVADAHVAALTAEGAVGHRFILTADGVVSLFEMGALVGKAFPEVKKRMPRFVLPHVVVRFVALFDKNLAVLLPDLGRREPASNARAREVLKIRFRSAEEAIVENARSLLAFGATHPK